MMSTGVALFSLLAVAALCHSDQIVQEGYVSGPPDPHFQELPLDQFDTMGGTRQLNFVQLDFLTSIIGGYTTDGSGVEVHIYAQLDADYYLDSGLLAATQALIDSIVPNTGVPTPISVFNTDTEQVIIDQPQDMVPWIGSGQIILDVFTQFIVWEEPPNVIYFDAGGTVRYTVTYDYEDLTHVFSDGFESGDTTEWSDTVP
jgi:hypothetical protein